MTLPTVEMRISHLLNNIAEAKRPCKACAAPLWWLRHSNGKLTPYTGAGVNHFIDCPAAQEFRAKKSNDTAHA